MCEGLLVGPELAGSRTIRPRSPFLRPSVSSLRDPSQLQQSLVATISDKARPSPLNPDTWNKILAEAEVPGRETIVAALRDGVPLSLQDIPYPGVRVPNHPTLYLDLPRVNEAVEEEVRQGRYVKLPPSTDPSLLNLSAMGVAPRFKSFEARRAFEGFSNQIRPLLKHAALDDFEGRPVSRGPGLAALGDFSAGVKWRVIHDLTHPDGANVNAFCESPYFQLPTAINFAKRLVQGSYIWKGDVDKAFRNVPVRKRDWPLLAFHVDGALYVDTRLPFGHALSPYYFVNMVGRPIQYVAIRRGATLLGALSSFVDDFFGGCSTYEEALDQMQIWLQVCADLGVPVSLAKTFLPAQVVEILGFIIDTVNMVISVDRERIQDILEEMDHLAGRKAVKKRELERLAGKMVFVCSVVPGGRTFMREILDTMNRLRSKSHWAHLTSGFRSDLEWWRRFAQNWNGVESIPPPVTVPWRWLTSDASGDRGLGVFCCGAALHMPLPLSQSTATDEAEKQMIIAETELIAAVLLVAFAAPLFGGEHLLLGIDNQVAISWIDSGTARRPRAMRALRILWRLQALHRVHISTRYIPSEENALADAASRLDTYRFFRASSNWRSSHLSSLRPRLETHGRSSLVAAPYGPAGGAAGLLVEFLVEGHRPSLRDQEAEVDRLLHTFSTLSSRFVAQEHRRLHYVPWEHRKEGWAAPSLPLDQGLCGLLGESDLLYFSGSTESSSTSRSATVPERSGQDVGKEGGQGRAVPAGAFEGLDQPRSEQPSRRHEPGSGEHRSDSILGLLSSRRADPEAGRQAEGSADARRRGGPRYVPPYHGPSLQDQPVRGALAQNRGASAVRPSLVPLESLHTMDVEFATPIIPDHIVHAIHDQSYTTVSFEVPRNGQPHRPSSGPADRTLLSTGVRPSGLPSRHPNLASDAPWRLEDTGSSHVVRRGRPDPESAWWAVEPQPMKPGVDPPS